MTGLGFKPVSLANRETITTEPLKRSMTETQKCIRVAIITTVAIVFIELVVLSIAHHMERLKKLEDNFIKLNGRVEVIRRGGEREQRQPVYPEPGYMP